MPGANIKTELTAFLGRNTHFNGDLRFSGILRIDGIFEGNIYSDGTLSIGETAVVKGEVKVATVIVQGQVQGTIEASHLLEVADRGRVAGRIIAGKLKIEEGVSLEAELRIAPPGSVSPIRSSSSHSPSASKDKK